MTELPISEINKLQNDPNIEEITEDVVYTDVKCAQSEDWGIDRVKAAEAWSSSSTVHPNGFKGQNVKIAVFDTEVSNECKDIISII